MNLNDERKINELKKCLLLLKKLRFRMMDLESLDLNGLEKSLVQGSYSHLDHVQANLNHLLLARETEPPENAIGQGLVHGESRGSTRR